MKIRQTIIWERFRLLVAAVVCLPLFLVNLGNAAEHSGLTARQIMERVEAAKASGDQGYDMIMTLVDHKGQQQQRVFKVFTKRSGQVVKRMMQVSHPPRLKDTGFLFFDSTGTSGRDEQWIYLPAIQKVKRIAASQRNDSFMGSDLNYSDLTSKEIDDYTYRKLKEIRMRGKAVWLIESLPVSSTVIDNTGYRKSIIAVEQERFIILRIKAWTREGSTVKIHDYDDFRFLNKVWTPHKVVVVSRIGQTTRHMTQIRLENVTLDQVLPDTLFTVRTLTKGFFGGHGSQ